MGVKGVTQATVRSAKYIHLIRVVGFARTAHMNSINHRGEGEDG